MPNEGARPGTGTVETPPTGELPVVTGTLVRGSGPRHAAAGAAAAARTRPGAGASPSGPAAADRWRRTDVLWATAAFCLYSLLAVAVYWQVWTGHPTVQTITGGDSYMDAWFLAYMAQAVLHGHNPFFTTFGNYPFGVDILDQSSQAFLGLVGLPITVAFGALATFNVWMTAGLALSAFTAYLLARRFVRWHPAAVLAGLVYGFSPYSIVESADGHLNIAFIAVPPLVFLVLHDLLVAKRDRWLRNGLLLAALLVVQFFISDEVLITTVVVGGIAVVVAGIVGHRSVRAALPGPAKGLVLGGVAAVAALAYPAWDALRGPGHIVGPIQPVAQAYRADLLGPLLPDAMERLAPSRLVQVAQHFASVPGENGSYLGIPLVLLVVLGTVWLWRRQSVLVVAITGAAAFVLSMGGALAVTGAPGIGPTGAATGGIPLPEALLYKIPALGNLIPVRISLFVALAAGLLVAMVLEHVWQWGRERWPRRPWSQLASGGLVAVLGLAVLVPLVPVAPFQRVAPTGIPAWFTRSHPQVPAGSVAVVYPYPSETFAQAQEWQAYAGLPFQMPGGYFLVPGPSGAIAFSQQLSYSRTTPLATALTDLWQGKPLPETRTWRYTLRAEMAGDHVRSVIAVPDAGPDPAGALAYLKWLLGPPSARQGGTVDWYGLSWAHLTAPTPPAPGTTTPATGGAAARDG